jgi:hypothetical protein
VQVAARFREPDDGRRTGRARRDLVEHLHRLCDERGPQEEVFGRIPRDRQLREHDQIAAGRFGRVIRVENAGGIALEVAHGDVQLGGGHPKARHRLKDTSATGYGGDRRARHSPDGRLGG